MLTIRMMMNQFELIPQIELLSTCPTAVEVNMELVASQN
jgi:hypothetical protein